MKKRLFLLFFLCISVISETVSQKLQLAEIFNDGLVLQRNAELEIWGNANSEEEIKVEIQAKSFYGKTDKDGFWNLRLSELTEGGPYQLLAISKNDTVKLNEVYVGEVWIAGGQSNMAWTLEKTANGHEHIANANNTNIRFVSVPNVNYEGHKVKGDLNWRSATVENVAPMSGIAYFFAKELQEKLNVPIGIICCYKGGTPAESWMSREKLLSDPNHAPIVEEYEKYLEQMGVEHYDELYTAYERNLNIYRDSVKKGFDKAIRPTEPMGAKNYKRPYGLYNTMLKRIIPYTAKGVIWYQGEANAPRAEQYQTLFPALIDEWRSDFRNENMPFLFVQLANYDHPKYDFPAWAELREAQLKTWQNDKNTAMVVTMDVGEKNDIHPIYKEPVGKRLSACALNKAYGFDIPYSGPVLKNVTFKGNKAILDFEFIYDGLTCDRDLTGFTVCGQDKHFIPAKAQIKNNKVIVSSEGVKKITAVRYNWENWGEGNLKNKAGFPASPFRTDDFPLQTQEIKAPKY